MSFGDEYGNREPGTRTRLPEDDPGSYGPRRGGGRAMSPSRGMLTVVAVVVLLIAAIAFANRGGSGSEGGVTEDDGAGGAQPTAPSGERPVEGENGGIPAGFAKTEQGAQSAAANYAVALGGTAMFNKESRHALVDGVYEPKAAADLKSGQDKAYSAAFLKKLGLDAEGDPPRGATFISRTIPVGTVIKEFSGGSATVAVWYTGLIGMAGEGSTDPVRTDWKTWTFQLQWSNGDWKIISDTQKDGPAPVPGDIPASSSQEISEAVEEYGGFTYAR